MKRKLKVFCSLLMVVQMILSLAVMPAYAEGEETTAEYAQLESPAVVYNMNLDWKFKKASGTVYPLTPALESVVDANGKQFYEVDYDDSDWETVSVPHAVNATDSFDGLGLDAGEAGLYRGFMFYRKTFTVPETDAGKKFIVEFEAFRQSLYVYVNGTLAGYYEAGVAPVGFDLTDYIVPGQENVIAVASDNSASRGNENDTKETVPGSTPGAANGWGYQWNSKDFNEVQGGLTGNVKLYAKNKIYQTLPLYSNMKTMGNYIYASNFDLDENSADITVEAEVRNEEADAKDITLQVDVVDNDGTLVATFESDATSVAAATDTADDQFLTTVPDDAYDYTETERNDVSTETVQVTKVTATQNVADLKFWSDVSPNLYTVYTYLKDGDTIIDAQKTVTGFREVIHDPDKGLLINGESTYLKGYAQRSTNEWAAIGVANDWLTDIDMQLIKESNANYIRWMHIAPNPVDIRGGDKYGVVSVVPAGDKEADAGGRHWDMRLESMRDVMICFRNSPSVIFWEAGNNQITAAHMQRMTDLRKELDPSGYRFMGCRTISSQEQVQAAEWVGTMLYRHGDSAYASMQALGKFMPILETEYHRNESPKRVWDDYSPPYYDYVNKWLGPDGDKTDGYDIWDQTQEDFSRTMFNSGDGYSYYYNNRVGGAGKNEYVGAAMMVWSDSNMHVRNCGVENARTSGRVDPIRMKKQSFYAIQAAQSTTPKIHILGHWNYPEYIEGDKENGNYWYAETAMQGSSYVQTGNMLQRNPTNKTVYVIGSEGLTKVELYVNDELVGTDTTPTDNFIYAFDGIDVTQSGRIYAKAYDDRNEVVAEHEIKTAGEAVTIKMTPVTGPDGLRADGSDYLYVDVQVVDEEGNVCPLDERKITFSINDETKAKFHGGYNSGYYGDGLEGAGERIVNRKNYVYAENGENRVFIQSTREAGEFTLTATAEGMQPVTIPLESVEVPTEGGLTTVMQQSFEQGDVPPPPKQPTADALKPLGKTFTADKNWGEEGSNVSIESGDLTDYYKLIINGTEMTFDTKKEQPFKPDSSTGVVGEVVPILDALKAAGADFTYTYATEGDVPEEFVTEGGTLPLLTITSGETTLYAANGSTVVIVNGEKNLMNYQTVTNEDSSSLVMELSAILGSINGVSMSTDTENKTLSITVTVTEATDEPVAEVSLLDAEGENTVTSLSYQGGSVLINAPVAFAKANLILAGYDDNKLVKVYVNEVSSESEPTAVPADIADLKTVKAMLWAEDMITPLADLIICEEPPEPIEAPTPEPIIDAVYEYDVVVVNNTCEEAMTNGIVSEDTSPDGTKYLTASGGDICLTGLGANSIEDLMWEADVRFNSEGSSIIPRNEGDKDFGSCVIRNDGDGVPKLSLQTGKTDYTRLVEIDPTAWYKIVLIGRYSAPDANIDMFVYKYEADGSKTLVGKYYSISQRNLWAGNKTGASHWNAGGGISVDNAKITRLGADAMYLESDADEIKAGNTMPFTYSATRQGQYITKPAVTWSVYNADNTAVLEDANISISETGVLNVGLQADEQTIYVRATATTGVYASKAIAVKAVDAGSVKFDTLTLTADRSYVSAIEPLTITVAATKNGEAVALTDSDLIWYAADSTDLFKLGDELKWIKIENGVVTVDPKAVSQDITIRAADPNDIVRGALPVHIKSSDALEGNEDGGMDKLLLSDNGEAALTNTELVESIDGTHARKVTAGISTGHVSETASDIVIEMDIKFTQEGAGFQPAKSGKVNTCVVYNSGQFSVQTGGSSYTRYGEISPDKWYHVTLIRKKDAYAHIVLEEYDENGELTNKKEFKDVNQRNNEATAFVNIHAGTVYDNLRVLTPVPTDITIDTDVKTVFAGNTVQATSELLWNGLVMKNPDASMFEYKIYDSENLYPREDNLVSVNADGLITIDSTLPEQDVYVRAVAKQSGKYASAKFTVASSDTFVIEQMIIDEETRSNIAGIRVTKAFANDLETAFVTQIFDENGVLKFTNVKQMRGKALKMGLNTVTLDIPLPEDFDKEKDTIKIYPVTKASTDEVTVPDGTLTVTKTATSVGFTAVPTYDAGSKIAVLVLKATADETDVKSEDILFFDIVESLTTESTFSWAQSYDGEYIVKTAGLQNKTQVVTADGEAAAAE